MQEDAAIVAVLPDGPPVLDGGGFRALLGMLTSAAESALGPEWRERLTDCRAAET